MVTEPERRLRNIVVADQQEATRVATLARAGQSFSGLVKRYSLDESTRAEDGDLGFVTRAMLEPAYATAAFKAARGAVFGPLKSSHGWNVGQVVDVRAARQLTFQGARATVRSLVVGQAAVSAWRDWLGERLEAANIQYSDDYRPDNPLDPPGEMPTPPAVHDSLDRR